MPREAEALWGSSYRLVASEKWRAKSAAMGKDVTQALVDYAAPKRGMRVLDLASGTGEPAISVTGLVAPDGHVTALDQSGELLEIAAERARQRSLTNLTIKQADANSLPFDDQAFDLVTSRFGVMFFEEPALREAYRVLKPGARACFAAWGGFEQPYWSGTMGVAHRYAGGSLLVAGQNPFRYGEPGSLSAALTRAGFESHEETREIPWFWPGTIAELWEQAQAVAAPFRPMLERIPAEQWETVNREVCAALQPYVEGGSVKLHARVVLAEGVKL